MQVTDVSSCTRTAGGGPRARLTPARPGQRRYGLKSRTSVIRTLHGAYNRPRALHQRAVIYCMVQSSAIHLVCRLSYGPAEIGRRPPCCYASVRCWFDIPRPAGSASSGRVSEMSHFRCRRPVGSLVAAPRDTSEVIRSRPELGCSGGGEGSRAPQSIQSRRLSWRWRLAATAAASRGSAGNNPHRAQQHA